jgi:hypothetical protein
VTLRSLLSIFALAALLLSPMTHVEAAASDHAGMAAAMDHCAEGRNESAPDGKSNKAIDCMIACAAIGCMGASLDPAALDVRVAPSVPPSALLVGLSPEADPPPPRGA